MEILLSIFTQRRSSTLANWIIGNHRPLPFAGSVVQLKASKGWNINSCPRRILEMDSWAQLDHLTNESFVKCINQIFKHMHFLRHLLFLNLLRNEITIKDLRYLKK